MHDVRLTYGRLAAASKHCSACPRHNATQTPAAFCLPPAHRRRRVGARSSSTATTSQAIQVWVEVLLVTVSEHACACNCNYTNARAVLPLCPLNALAAVHGGTQHETKPQPYLAVAPEICATSPRPAPAPPLALAWVSQYRSSAGARAAVNTSAKDAEAAASAAHTLVHRGASFAFFCDEMMIIRALSEMTTSAAGSCTHSDDTGT